MPPSARSGHDGLQHFIPVVDAMDVPGREHRPFAVPELVEDKNGVMTDSTKVAVVGCPFLPGPYTGKTGSVLSVGGSASKALMLKASMA